MPRNDIIELQKQKEEINNSANDGAYSPAAKNTTVINYLS